MKKIFETKIRSRSLSFENAGVKICCNRNLQPPAKLEWFAENGESLWNSLDIESFAALIPEIHRSMGLRKNETASLATVEHLAPIFLLYPQIHFQVFAQSQELPILDGSAYPWYEAVRKIAGLPQEVLFYDAPIREHFEWNGGWMDVSPAETLEIEYSLSHGNYADDAYAAIYDAEDLVKLFPARTFIFEEDFLRAKECGLLSAVDENCGMLLREKNGALEILSGGKFRMPSEPVMHKMLDLIGDLSLPAPILPRLRIRIHNGGHFAHRQLLERLLNAFRNSSQID